MKSNIRLDMPALVDWIISIPGNDYHICSHCSDRNKWSKNPSKISLKLSLEEIHEVLGRRITKELNQDWVEGASIPVYLIVNLAKNKN